MCTEIYRRSIEFFRLLIANSIMRWPSGFCCSLVLCVFCAVFFLYFCFVFVFGSCGFSQRANTKNTKNMKNQENQTKQRGPAQTPKTAREKHKTHKKTKTMFQTRCRGEPWHFVWNFGFLVFLLCFSLVVFVFVLARFVSFCVLGSSYFCFLCRWPTQKQNKHRKKPKHPNNQRVPAQKIKTSQRNTQNTNKTKFPTKCWGEPWHFCKKFCLFCFFLFFLCFFCKDVILYPSIIHHTHT